MSAPLGLIKDVCEAYKVFQQNSEWGRMGLFIFCEDRGFMPDLLVILGLNTQLLTT